MDPTAGPLQAFAYDLRKLRTEAGGPTYRSMARAAGYSASTLSEAAGGLHRPSLDVVLAYVGACGGDVEVWRARWHRLDRELSRSSVRAGEPAGDASRPVPSDPTRTPPEPGTPSPPSAAGGARSRRRYRWIAVSGGVLALALLLISVGWFQRGGPTAPAAGPSCPPAQADAPFTGTTYGSGVNVRREPTLGSEVLYSLPPGCVLGLTGYCLGQNITDATAGTPDVRWFLVAGGGVVASAVIHGNPPAGLRPSDCPEGRPAPASITVGVAGHPTGLRLSATGTHVEIVGFAVRYADDPALPADHRWHQVLLTDTTTPAFDAVWRADQLRRRPAPTEDVMVAAVACLGGQGPTDVLAVRTARMDGTSRPATLPPDGDERERLANAACAYPRAN
ncbi:helix-turn-helix domain-containing protein [Micromonospora cathayae]|uniref:Helix-turn-helix transcriptional regulator n=1 Tax=Micromonospora cathayae TaxID=3028804 RepID=A0ABY7ZSI7_9ACTN|nr:helix-turn-helix transcriptional regulator [Micromonospora sp. HUAS 3]WDZ86002.1 helix-turn-helix transcriptional regulator [Micromonospora sp. HUAS 3]